MSLPIKRKRRGKVMCIFLIQLWHLTKTKHGTVTEGKTNINIWVDYVLHFKMAALAVWPWKWIFGYKEKRVHEKIHIYTHAIFNIIIDPPLSSSSAQYYKLVKTIKPFTVDLYCTVVGTVNLVIRQHLPCSNRSYALFQMNVQHVKMCVKHKFQMSYRWLFFFLRDLQQ